MQKFLIKDGQGVAKNWGNPLRAAKLARRIVGHRAVCAVQGRDVFWMLPEHEEYFRALIGDFKVTNTAANVVAGIGNRNSDPFAQ